MFYRLIDEQGVRSPTGTLLLDRAVQACFWESLNLLEAMLEDPAVTHSDALLLRDCMIRPIANYPPDHPRVSQLAMLELRAGLPAFKIMWSRDYLGNATSNTKAIKNIVAHLEDQQPDDYHTCSALLALRGSLGGLARQRVANLLNTIDRLLHALNTSHPMSRDLSLVCLNKYTALLFEECLASKAESCLAYLNVLVQESVNIDINLARKSMVEEVLGKASEAADTWAELEALLSSGDALLPGVVFHNDTFTTDTWRGETRTHFASKGLEI